MRDDEWTAGVDPQAMLLLVEGRVPERRLRLFAAACCRRAALRMTDPRSRSAQIELLALADGLSADRRPSHPSRAKAAHAAARRAAAAAAATAGYTADALSIASAMAEEALPGASFLRLHRPSAAAVAAREAELAAQCDLLREILGNPFRPVLFDPAWSERRGGRVGGLARRILRDEEFVLMPELADALEDVGCDEMVVLLHCRQRGGHDVGCWVLEGLLEPAA
jgi:hypothetical protein